MWGMETACVERIYLIGLSGSGKSTVAELVAAQLGWSCFDVDADVQESTGSSIPEIFQERGEAGFRELEREALARTAAVARVVVATGAGIVDNPENLELMQRAGWMVCLLVSPDHAYRRLVGHFANRHSSEREAPIHGRPLLAGDRPLQTLRQLNQRRQGAYSRADEAISTDDLTAQAVAGRVVGGIVGRGLLSPAGAVTAVRHLRSEYGAHYDSVVAWGGLAAQLPGFLRDLDLPPRVHIVSDAAVAALYEVPLMSCLMRAGFTPLMFRLPPGEASKSREQLGLVHDWLAERRAERGEAILAFGGGVVGDLAGFAAATYLRGMPLVQLPSSLLAQVDASIGGKVAVNHPLGKNLIGAFYQPRLVLADPALLLTLPDREMVEGWAEVIKHGVALDRDYFLDLERVADALLAKRPEPLTRIIGRSVSLKGEVVEGDERERDGGKRHLLNYGHTIGHAVESVAGYGSWLHGEAVAAGMVAEAQIGLQLGITPAEVVTRQVALLGRFGLPTSLSGLSASRLLAASLWDKKVSGGTIRLVVPTGLGEATLISGVGEAEMRRALLAVGASS